MVFFLQSRSDDDHSLWSACCSSVASLWLLSPPPRKWPEALQTSWLGNFLVKLANICGDATKLLSWWRFLLHPLQWWCWMIKNYFDIIKRLKKSLSQTTQICLVLTAAKKEKVSDFRNFSDRPNNSKLPHTCHDNEVHRFTECTFFFRAFLDCMYVATR